MQTQFTDSPDWCHFRGSLQKIKSIKNPIKFCISLNLKLVTFVNHFDGHFAYLKTLDFCFKSLGWNTLLTSFSCMCVCIFWGCCVFWGVGWGEQNCDNHGVAGCSLHYLATETFLWYCVPRCLYLLIIMSHFHTCTDCFVCVLFLIIISCFVCVLFFDNRLKQ